MDDPLEKQARSFVGRLLTEKVNSFFVDDQEFFAPKNRNRIFI